MWMKECVQPNGCECTRVCVCVSVVVYVCVSVCEWVCVHVCVCGRVRALASVCVCVLGGVPAGLRA